MTFVHVAMQIATATALQELEASRVLRFPPKACYDRAFAVLDETYAALTTVQPVRAVRKQSTSIWGPDGWLDEMRTS